MSSSIKIFLGLLVVVIIAVAVAVFGFGVKLPTSLGSKPPAPAAVSDLEARDLLALVGKAVVLPSNEIPTIATVADPSKLEGQPFFAKAQVGDKVLIYSTAQKAILWSTSLGKVLEVSGLTIATPPANAPSTPTTPTPTPVSPAKKAQ